MRWLALFALAACTESEPSECGGSDVQLEHVTGIRYTDYDIPSIAVGGTLSMQMRCTTADYPGYAEWDVPYAIENEASAAVTITPHGSSLTMTAVHEGSNTFRVTSPDGRDAYGSFSVTAKAGDHVIISPSGIDEPPPDASLVYATQLLPSVHARLYASDGDLVVDDEQVVTGPPGARYESSSSIPVTLPGLVEYDAVAPGSYSIALTTGESTYSAPFVVVDHADSVSLIDPDQSLVASMGKQNVCFQAQLAGSFVSGLRWTYNVEGSPQTGTHCVGVDPIGDANHDGAISIYAAAGGPMFHADIPIRPM
jgi:hypothetical protein